MTTGQGTGTGDYSVVNLRNWVRSESFGDDIGDGIEGHIEIGLPIGLTNEPKFSNEQRMA